MLSFYFLSLSLSAQFETDVVIDTTLSISEDLFKAKYKDKLQLENKVIILFLCHLARIPVDNLNSNHFHSIKMWLLYLKKGMTFLVAVIYSLHKFYSNSRGSHMMSLLQFCVVYLVPKSLSLESFVANRMVML